MLCYFKKGILCFLALFMLISISSPVLALDMPDKETWDKANIASEKIITEVAKITEKMKGLNFDSNFKSIFTVLISKKLNGLIENKIIDVYNIVWSETNDKLVEVYFGFLMPNGKYAVFVIPFKASLAESL